MTNTRCRDHQSASSIVGGVTASAKSSCLVSARTAFKVAALLPIRRSPISGTTMYVTLVGIFPTVSRRRIFHRYRLAWRLELAVMTAAVHHTGANDVFATRAAESRRARSASAARRPPGFMRSCVTQGVYLNSSLLKRDVTRQKRLQLRRGGVVRGAGWPPGLQGVGSKRPYQLSGPGNP